MRTLSDTLSRLAAFGKSLPEAVLGSTHLTELHDFGSNDGGLRAWLHVPPTLAPNAPLVVVLHGCTQTAAGYDVGSGWSALADRHGFAVLFPEQQRQNNQNLCFNWFLPEDTGRGAGEPLSIRQMIAAVISRHGIDPGRVYVTGLSAGGAMTSVMLATYPEVFAGGAIIAGLPYGTAATLPQAFDRMRGHGITDDASLAGLVRSASPHPGPWPILSVWHGSTDATVSPLNAEAILAQWRPLHRVPPTPTLTEIINGYPRRVWCNAAGREVLEEYSITGMGHGTPLDTRDTDPTGQAGAYMLEAGINSTRHICRFWGLAPAAAARPAEFRAAPPRPAPAALGVSDVGRTIKDALRSAGLVR